MGKILEEMNKGTTGYSASFTVLCRAPKGENGNSGLSRISPLQ